MSIRSLEEDDRFESSQVELRCAGSAKRDLIPKLAANPRE